MYNLQQLINAAVEFEIKLLYLPIITVPFCSRVCNARAMEGYV